MYVIRHDQMPIKALSSESYLLIMLRLPCWVAGFCCIVIYERKQGCYLTVRIKLQNGLLLINFLAILLVVIITLFPSSVLRVILGLPFVLFFPGYALITALFPGKKSLSTFGRIALSFGFSIAIVSLTGLILNYTQWGIRLYPGLISLFAFTIAMSAVAGLRQRGLPETERVSISFNLSPPSGQTFSSRILSIVLIVTILGTIGTLGYVIATPKVGEKFTEFYILGTQGKATNYPKELKVGEEGKVTIGIVNREQETVIYRVEVRIDGTKNSETGPLTIENEAKWQAAVSFRQDKAGENQKVEFLLYKHGQNEPYLKPLYLWVNVKRT